MRTASQWQEIKILSRLPQCFKNQFLHREGNKCKNPNWIIDWKSPKPWGGPWLMLRRLSAQMTLLRCVNPGAGDVHVVPGHRLGGKAREEGLQVRHARNRINIIPQVGWHWCIKSSGGHSRRPITQLSHDYRVFTVGPHFPTRLLHVQYTMYVCTLYSVHTALTILL